jgi:hypothetical protein
LLVAAIDEAVGDGDAVFAFVGEDGRREGAAFLAILIREGFKTLEDIPAVIRPPQ